MRKFCIKTIIMIPIIISKLNIFFLKKSKIGSIILLLKLYIYNEIRYKKHEDKFTMLELFVTLRKSIWSELPNRENVNSYRRGLQRIHVKILTDMITNQNPSFNYDAIILARQDLIEIQKLIKNAQHIFGIDEMTKAHLSEISARIEASLKAYLQKKI